MTIRKSQIVAAGAAAVAAVAAPLAIALVSAPVSQAGPACLSHGMSNGVEWPCSGYSNGQPFIGGTPNVGYLGPNSTNGSQFGASTGPLLPGQTWRTPVG